MNSENPSHDEKEDITSLVARSSHDLSTKESLVIRGLQDVAQLLQADPHRLAEDAIKLHRVGKFAEAVAACDSALRIDRDYDVVLLQIKGTSLAKQGRVLEGLEFIDEALRINSDFALSWYVKSRVLQMGNRTEERLECLRRVIQLEPAYVGAWKEVGDCLLALGRYGEAVEAFESGLRQNPSDEGCRSQKEIALAELARGQEEPTYMVVYDSSNGWHVMNEDDIEWDHVGPDRNGRETGRPQQTCYGPFFSNYDPNEGPVGTGRELAEALAEEKRRLYPNGPVQGGPGS